MGNVVKLPPSRMPFTKHCSRSADVFGFPRWCHQSVILARGSGIVIRKHGAVFREGYTAEDFLADARILRDVEWCWHFTNGDHACDGMAHKAITWTLMPRISKYLERWNGFNFYCHVERPEPPDWLDAEYFEDEKLLALYGDRRGDLAQIGVWEPNNG